VLGFPIQNKINECKKRRLSFLKSNSFEISLFQRISQERRREGKVELHCRRYRNATRGIQERTRKEEWSYTVGDTGNARRGKFSSDELKTFSKEIISQFD
jgi:hypothetical protein